MFNHDVEYHVDASRGLEIYTWKEAMAHEELSVSLASLVSSSFFPNSLDQFHAAACASFSSGIVVYVQPTVGEDGVVVRETLMLDTALSAHASADMIVIIAKEGAAAHIVSSMVGGSTTTVHERNTVVILREGADVQLTLLDMPGDGAYASDTCTGMIASHASLHVSHAVAGGGLVKRHTTLHVLGMEASASIKQGAVLSRQSILDVETVIRHRSSDTRAHVDMVALVSDQARALVRTGLDMPIGLERLIGAERLSFVTLSPRAKVDAIPALDISTHDVSATHSMSISHVRPEDTFYARTRGFSETEGRRLCLEGHLGQVFSEGSDPRVLSLLYDALNRLD